MVTGLQHDHNNNTVLNGRSPRNDQIGSLAIPPSRMTAIILLLVGLGSVIEDLMQNGNPA